MEETISLQDIFRILKKRLAMITVITLLATAASAIITYFFLTPKYEADTEILVNQSIKDQAQFNTGVVQANVQLVNTYSDIIKSPTILKDVIDKLHLDITPDGLQGQLSVESKQNSQVFTVAVQDKNPAKALKIANTIATVFADKIPTIMSIDNVSILSKARLAADGHPVAPKPTLNMAIAFVVGLMVSVGLAFLMEYLDNTIKTEEDIEQFLELPVLGAVMEASANDLRAVSKARAARRMGGEGVEA